MKRDSRVCYSGVAFLVIFCVLLGYFTARANGAEERVEWTLLRGELSGREPDTVSVEHLAAAMSMAILNHKEQAMPLFQTSMIIACNMKVRPKRAAVFILYTATLTLPELSEDFLALARQICPQSGAADKIVLPKEDIGEDLSTPLNFAGIAPPSGPFIPITPHQDVRR